jgi:hypothetical protein
VRTEKWYYVPLFLKSTHHVIPAEAGIQDLIVIPDPDRESEKWYYVPD